MPRVMTRRALTNTTQQSCQSLRMVHPCGELGVADIVSVSSSMIRRVVPRAPAEAVWLSSVHHYYESIRDTVGTLKSIEIAVRR